jgi:hypothetical protein
VSRGHGNGNVFFHTVGPWSPFSQNWRVKGRLRAGVDDYLSKWASVSEWCPSV